METNWISHPWYLTYAIQPRLCQKTWRLCRPGCAWTPFSHLPVHMPRHNWLPCSCGFMRFRVLPSERDARGNRCSQGSKICRCKHFSSYQLAELGRVAWSLKWWERNFIFLHPRTYFISLPFFSEGKIAGEYLSWF